MPSVADDGTLAPCSVKQLLLYFLYLGTFGFGGPIALVGRMQRDLVESRRWVDQQDYIEGLALSQLAPGPLAAQLAIYLGWVRGRVVGATLVGCVFVLPSFLMTLAIAVFYMRYGGLSWIQGTFYGIGAAVIAIIAHSAYKLVGMTLGKDWLLWCLFAISAAVTAWTQSEIVWVFLLSGMVAIIIKAPPHLARTVTTVAPWPMWLLAGLHGVASIGTLYKLGLFFAAAGAFVFGSGLAIVPFLHGGVVNQFHWLTDRQFLDAVAVAMITPGPVVITVAFIGYLVAGPVGAIVAALGVFLPCYLFVVVPAPYYRRFAQNAQIHAFVAGVTSAATGAIGGAVFVLGERAITDVPTLLITLITLLLLLTVKKIPEPMVILMAGVVGFLLKSKVAA